MLAVSEGCFRFCFAVYSACVAVPTACNGIVPFCVAVSAVCDSTISFCVAAITACCGVFSLSVRACSTRCGAVSFSVCVCAACNCTVPFCVRTGCRCLRAASFGVSVKRACDIIFIVVEYLTVFARSGELADTASITGSNFVVYDFLRISRRCLVQHIKHLQLFVTAGIALRMLAVCVLVCNLGYDRFVLHSVNANRYLLRKLRLGFIIHKQRLYLKVIRYHILFCRF